MRRWMAAAASPALTLALALVLALGALPLPAAAASVREAPGEAGDGRGEPQISPEQQLTADAAPPAQPLTPAERLRHWYEQLAADDATGRARRDAARRLLDSDAARAEPEVAAGLVIRGLGTEAGSDVWRPLLEALALHEAPLSEPLAAELGEALLELTEHVEPGFRPHLAAAMGHVIDNRLAQRLVEHAQDPERSIGARLAAVLALGHHRTQSTAGVLVSLTEPHQPGRVRQAAFVALETLTGITRHGADADAWAGWWRDQARLSRRQWERMLIDTLGRRNEQDRVERQHFSARLQDLVRSRYRAADAEQRGERLAELLDDPLEPVRELAVALAIQRLAENGPFEEPLRRALRDRLDDPMPEIRQRAAVLLRDLRDEPAADRMASRLAAGAESAVPVLRVKLLTLTRLPRVAAIEPVTALLSHPALQSEAAAMLAAAAEAGLIDRPTADVILEQVRWTLARQAEQPPLPQMVRLLGRLGREPDWQRIADWLDSEDGPVKQAAAQVWAESTRSLAPLANRASDPDIAPIFLRAAAQRGRDTATLEALLRHPHDDEELLEHWHRALIALAGRLSTEAVLAAVDRVTALDTEPALREAMLSAALERFNLPEPTASENGDEDAGEDERTERAGWPRVDGDGDALDAQSGARHVPGGTVHRPPLIDPTDPRAAAPATAIEIGETGTPEALSTDSLDEEGGDRVLGVDRPALGDDPRRRHAALLLARASARLDANRTTRGLDDLHAAARFGAALTGEQHRTAAHLLIRAHLQARDLSQARRIAREKIDNGPLDEDRASALAELFLDAASERLDDDEFEDAMAVVEALNDLIGRMEPAPHPHATDRLARLEQRIERAAPMREPDEPTAPDTDEDDLDLDPPRPPADRPGIPSDSPLSATP